MPIVRGICTNIPILYRANRRPTGGSVDPRYCYSVWLRHLSLLNQCGVGPRFTSIAELGPGDSLGIGLAGLLTGASRLFALDVVDYAVSHRNVAVLRQLLQMFQAREPIPDSKEFPGIFPTLDDYSFPANLLPSELLLECLSAERIADMEAALRGGKSRTEIAYCVPWTERASAPLSGRVQLVYSQAVLEHIEDIEGTHREVIKWLEPGGVVSHTIDFRSHGLTPTWDGHLQYSPRLWKWVRGARPYLLGRRSPSEHLRAMEAAGFEILDVRRVTRAPEIAKEHVHSMFNAWSEDDRSTCSMVVVARSALTS